MQPTATIYNKYKSYGYTIKKTIIKLNNDHLADQRKDPGCYIVMHHFWMVHLHGKPKKIGFKHEQQGTSKKTL